MKCAEDLIASCSIDRFFPAADKFDLEFAAKRMLEGRCNIRTKRWYMSRLLSKIAADYAVDSTLEVLPTQCVSVAR